MTTTAAIRRSTTAPAVTFQNVTGGTRVRREGKGDHLFITRDTNKRAEKYLVIQHGAGVVGAIGNCDGDWVLEIGIFRHWDKPGMFQAFPSSTVRTFWHGSAEEAMTEAAMYWCS